MLLVPVLIVVMARRWSILMCAFVLTLNIGWTTAKKKSVLDYDENDVQRVYKEWLVSAVRTVA